jgi:hypothetical protein
MPNIDVAGNGSGTQPVLGKCYRHGSNAVSPLAIPALERDVLHEDSEQLLVPPRCGAPAAERVAEVAFGRR